MTYARIVPVEFNHCDPAGIVFFPRYFDMMQDAFEAFMKARGLPAARIMKETHYYLPLVRAECDFRAPLIWGDRLRVEVKVNEVRRRSFSVDYRFRNDEDRTVAQGYTAHVVADKSTRRAIPVPEELRRALEDPA